MARRSTARSSGGWVRLIAFVAVMLLALGLFLSWLLGNWEVTRSIAYWCREIAMGIALIIPVFLSYYEARHKGTVWFVLWVIAVIIIAVFYILPAFGIYIG